jgi:hypothetical protein
MFQRAADILLLTGVSDTGRYGNAFPSDSERLIPGYCMKTISFFKKGLTAPEECYLNEVSYMEAVSAVRDTGGGVTKRRPYATTKAQFPGFCGSRYSGTE